MATILWLGYLCYKILAAEAFAIHYDRLQAEPSEYEEKGRQRLMAESREYTMPGSCGMPPLGSSRAC